MNQCVNFDTPMALEWIIKVLSQCYEKLSNYYIGFWII